MQQTNVKAQGPAEKSYFFQVDQKCPDARRLKS